MKNVVRIILSQLILVGALHVPQASADPIGLARGVTLCFDRINDCTDGFRIVKTTPARTPTTFRDSGTFTTTSLDMSYSGMAQADF